MAKAGVRGRPIAPLVLSARERDYLERQVRRRRVAGRYLSDAASFCDVRTAWQARTWLPNSATMNTRLASGVADFCTIAAMVCLTRPAPVDHELSAMIRSLP